MNQSLEDSLVEFFRHTNVSCAILKALCEFKEPVKFDQLVDRVGSVMTDRIPDYAIEGAVRAALKLLKTTGWVHKSDDGFSLTALGRDLASRITECKPRGF